MSTQNIPLSIEKKTPKYNNVCSYVFFSFENEFEIAFEPLKFYCISLDIS